MRKIIVLASVFCWSCSIAQLSNTQAVLNSLQSDSFLLNASWGVCIVDNANGSILIEKDKNLSLIPASSTKTITTATALALLGENYTYKTSISYIGTIVDSTLIGNIVVIGTGDPTIASSKMEEAISAEQFLKAIISGIQRLGIRKIQGKIVTDASCFEGFPTPATWNWSDIGNNYGAGTFGFNYADNEFSVQCNPTQQSSAPSIQVSPSIPSLRITNRFFCIDTVKDGDEAYIFGSAYNNERVLSGPVPLNASITVKGSMPDPPLFFAELLSEKLAVAGIDVTNFPSTDKVSIDDFKQAHQIYSYTSAPLSAIVSATNHKSLNLYAETLVKTIAKENSTESSTEKGLQLIYAYWASKGLNLTGFYMKDGSGLSRHNAISPYHFTQMMYLISKEPYYAAFKNSLAIAGESGTLKNLCAGSSAAGRIIAKSGTVERGISYTGYVKSASGKTLSFCMIFNNYNCSNSDLRKKIEQLMITMSKI